MVSRVSALNNILERGLRGGDQPNMNQKLFLEPPTPSPCLRLCQMGLKSLVGGEQRITGGLRKVGKKNPRPG